jgi:hypothetical protein
MDLQSMNSGLPGGNTTDRYQDYIKQYQDYARDAQAKDAEWQAWQADASRYTPDMGAGPSWNGQDFFKGWYNTLNPNQQQDYTFAHQDVKAQNANSLKGRLGSIAQGIPMAVVGAGAMGAFGGGLEGMFGAPEAAGAATDAATMGGANAFNNPAFVSMPETSGGWFSGAYNNPAFTAMPGINSSLGAGAATAGGSGVSDFFKGLTDGVREKPLSSLVSGMNTINSLAGLYSAYQQNQDYGNLAGNLMSMYGDDSAYAKQLRKELQRRDAASGRRSQYGPRSVELQARLAELNSRNAETLANIYQQQGINRDNMFKSGLNLAKGSGAMDWADRLLSPALKSLFGG